MGKGMSNELVHLLNSCLYPQAARAASSMSSMLVMRLSGDEEGTESPSWMPFS